MPKASPAFCLLCGNLGERFGFKVLCLNCAVEINPNGGLVFPSNEKDPMGPPQQRYHKLRATPYTIFDLFKS